MDSNGNLVVEIQNRLPIELLDLTEALVSFAKEFQGYADAELQGPYRTSTRLYVKEIRSGSIITELVPFAAGLLPLISDVNTVVGFAKHLKASVEWLLAPKDKEASSISTTTLQNLNSIVEPVAKDSASQLIIKAETINYAPVYLSLSSNDAKVLQNNIGRELALRSTPLVGLHKQVVMHWYQARNDPSSKAGDKAIIESISPRPVKVIFKSDRIKYQMLKIEENLFDRAFLVDVYVETVDNKPMLYKIAEVHEELSG